MHLSLHQQVCRAISCTCRCTNRRRVFSLPLLLLLFRCKVEFPGAKLPPIFRLQRSSSKAIRVFVVVFCFTRDVSQSVSIPVDTDHHYGRTVGYFSLQNIMTTRLCITTYVDPGQQHRQTFVYHSLTQDTMHSETGCLSVKPSSR